MKYFTIPELCCSETAIKEGIVNVPGEEELDNLNRLVDTLLDPIREMWGRPIKVNSGYRCKELNAIIGGSKTSHHMTGNAADITAVAGTLEEKRRLNGELFDMIKKSDLLFTQLIDEYNLRWLHISYDPTRPRQRQIFKLG